MPHFASKSFLFSYEKHFRKKSIVWRVPYGKKKIQIALLFEHKTAPDAFIQLQLLQYMIDAWNRNISESRSKSKYLIPIVPIVIYQNKQNKKWEKRSLEQLFKDLDPELLRFIPCFTYIITDTSLESQAVLAKMQSMRALMVFKTMYQVIKTLVKEKELVSFFENITPTPAYEDAATLFLERRIWVYVFGNTEVKPKTILEKSHILSPQKVNYMTGLEAFYVESVAEGVAKGKAEGEQKAKLFAKIIKIHLRCASPAAIAEQLATDIETVNEAIAEYEAD